MNAKQLIALLALGCGLEIQLGIAAEAAPAEFTEVKASESGFAATLPAKSVVMLEVE